MGLWSDRIKRKDFPKTADGLRQWKIAKKEARNKRLKNQNKDLSNKLAPGMPRIKKFKAKTSDKKVEKIKQRRKYDAGPLGGMQQTIDKLAKERTTLQESDSLTKTQQNRLAEIQRIINLTDRQMKAYKSKNKKLSDNL